MKTLVITSALALSFGGVVAPAFAEPIRTASNVAATIPAADSAMSAPQAEKTRRYCVKGNITGSRIERKQCKTRADWLKEGFDPLAAT